MTLPKVRYRVVHTIADLVRGLGYETNDPFGVEEALRFLAVTALGRPN